jgi:phosphatidylserine/phosphatidylglycerophosphate/cardiolipin synthase-like enzyme
MANINEIALQRGFNANSIALALSAAAEAHALQKKALSIEMVWTGPSPSTNSLRRTDQALLEVINKAKHELWIVSFSAYRVRSVLEAINQSSGRGVKISLILESAEESEGKLSGDQIKEIQEQLSESVRFLIWPTENREPNSHGRRGLLHAKCAIADKHHLFVSSANLSEAALRRNIELGVLMSSSKHGTQIDRHLNWLVESKTLMPFV